MGPSGMVPFVALLEECFPCPSLSTGNGALKVTDVDLAQADARE